MAVIPFTVLFTQINKINLSRTEENPKKYFKERGLFLNKFESNQEITVKRKINWALDNKLEIYLNKAGTTFIL